MNYTLKMYYEEAGIEPIPPWAKDITLRNPYTRELVKPMWHQVDGLARAFSMPNSRSGLFDDMGSGKTMPAQAFAIWNAWANNKTVVLMPGVLLGQFLNSLKKMFSPVQEHLSAEIYHGAKAKRDKAVARWQTQGSPDIVLTTYDLFRKEYQIFCSLFHYDALVMDECRVLGNPNSATALAISSFMGRNGEKAALLMNGTPGKNSLADLFGYIDFLTPGVYKGKSGFDHMHVEYTTVDTVVPGKRGGLDICKRLIVSGFRNLDQLYQNLYLQARRVEKEDVLKELPGKRLIPVHFKLSPKHKALYDKLVREKLIIFADDSMIDISYSAAVRNTCMQIVVHPQMVQLDEESEIFKVLDELLEELAPSSTNKVFILAHYRATIEKIGKRYEKYKPALIYGGSNTEKEKVRFQEDDNCLMCVANYLSGGVGLDFQNNCHTVICFEPTTVPGDFKQAVDRVDRKGQLHKVFVYILIATGTIYSKTVATMRKKDAEILSVVSKGRLQAELCGSADDDEEVVDDDLEEW